MPAPDTYTREYGDFIEDRFIALGQPEFDPDTPEPPDPPDPPYPDPVPDPAIQAQIAREPFKAGGKPKEAFDIILSMITPNAPLWTASYKVKLTDGNGIPNGHGWTSGDRAGYTKAYMHLDHLAGGFAHGRVSFWVITDDNGDYISKVNDRYMDEIQTTNIGYDGKIAKPPFNTQGQAPPYDPEAGVVDDGPDVRPIILFADPMGRVIENRSYTATAVDSSKVRFSDAGFYDWVAETGSPRIDNNGFGNAPHPIFYEQQVRARFKMGSRWQRVVGIEYVSFRPDYPILNKRP